MASTNEPTSCLFVANLGNLDAAVVARIERWAEASCVEHAMRRHEEDGTVALYAVRTQVKTARQYQGLLRTLASQWKMPFGALNRGWLTLLTDTEYRAAIGSATERTEGAARDHVEVLAASECNVPRLHGLGEASAPAAPKLAEPGVVHVMLLSLGDGFDQRAQAVYERLITDRRAVMAM